MRARLLTVLLFAVLAPVAQAATSADKISYKVFSDYAKDGSLDPCQYTTHELQVALDHITPDVRQYASDYPDAVKAAIASRARGGCDPKSTPTPTATTPATTTAPGATPPATGGTTATTDAGGGLIPAPTVSQPPGPADPSVSGSSDAGNDAALRRAAARSPDNGAPAPLIGLGILAILAAMLAALMLTVRRLGAGGGPLAPVYHSWREARWRAGGVWADFADWLRLGR